MFFVVAVLGVVGVVFGSIQARKRREALVALAAELDLTYDPSPDRTHDEQFAHFEIFRRGHSRAAYNTLRGTLSLNDAVLPVKLGDFTYKVTTGSGKDRRTTTYNFSYLIAQLPYPTMPDLLIRPEHLFDKLAGVFSDRDIDFESEEFSRRFMVASPDRKFAYDVCHPRMIEYLLETRPPAIDIEFARLCLTDGSATWKPEQFRWALEFLGGFLARWPEHVVRDLAQRT